MINSISAKNEHPGKIIFYSVKGKYGTCNTCHTNGDTALRWNMETMSVDPEEGRKIPSLKGIGERKDPEQIERSIKLMQKLFEFKLTDEQIKDLVDYISTL